MKKFCLILVAVLSSLALSGAPETSFSEMFAQRSKCVVALRYSIELEEDRKQIYTTGLVVDSDGLIVLPSAEIPNLFSPSELKNFKVFFRNGNADGYPSDYLGSDSLTGFHYVKIRGGLPKQLVPFSKFSRSRAKIGDEVWGVGMFPQVYDFRCYLFKSYVNDIDRRPLLRGGTGGDISTVGGAVFDIGGNFVGWAETNARRDAVLLLNDKSVPIQIGSPSAANSFLFPEVIDESLKRLPSKPEGDSHGWLGLVNTKVLKRDVAEMMGLEKCALVVSDVPKDSPAGRSGIVKGDIVVSFDGKDIENLGCDDFTVAEFGMKIGRKRAGDKLVLGIVRGMAAPKDFEVVIGESPLSMRRAQREYFKRIGFSIREFLFDDAILRKSVDKKTEQPVVKYVKPNSPAASALPSRLSAGDIVKEINSVPVKNFKDAAIVLRKIDSDKTVGEIVILAEGFNETKVVRIKLD